MILFLERAVRGSKHSELECVQQLHQLRASAMLEPQLKSRSQCEDAEMQSAVQRGLNLANNIQASTMKPAGGTALSHDGQGAVTITKDGDRVVYTMQLSCTEQNEVFCARDNDDNRLVVFVDDGSEVTLIAASVVSKEWEESA